MKLSNVRLRLFEFISVSLLLGLTAAIGTIIFFGWLADEVLDGETRQFDEVTRAAVHQLASPTMTTMMRGISFLGSTLFLTVATIGVEPVAGSRLKPIRRTPVSVRGRWLVPGRKRT